jgi:hypothetical protein
VAVPELEPDVLAETVPEELAEILPEVLFDTEAEDVPELVILSVGEAKEVQVA